jgi:hypothetical protein
MNKQLTQTEIAECLSPVRLKPMTRYEKLTRLANLIRSRHEGVYIFHLVEYMTPVQLAGTFHPYSAFSLALGDQELRNAGLTPDLGVHVSIKAGQEFFELSKNDLHEFSCDCGGGISNVQMASRIDQIAGQPPAAAEVIDSRTWTG